MACQSSEVGWIGRPYNMDIANSLKTKKWRHGNKILKYAKNKKRVPQYDHA